MSDPVYSDPVANPPAPLGVPLASPPDGSVQITPGPRVPTARFLGSPLEGQVVALWIQDQITGEVLPIYPSAGGIWLNDFDPGRPVLREVITNRPGAHGTFDQTQYYGNRGVTLSLTCIAAPDATGVVQSASAWAGLVEGWTVLGRRLRIVYQLRGMAARQVDVRYSSSTAPIIGNDVDRQRRLMTLGFVADGPCIYELPLPGIDVDPARPDYYLSPASAADTTPTAPGSPTAFNYGPGIAPGASYLLPAAIVGTIAVPPVLGVRGPATKPVFIISDPMNGVRARIAFTAVAAAGEVLVLSAAETLIVDVANRTAMVYGDPNYGPTGRDAYRFVDGVATWERFLVEPQFQNNVGFSCLASSGATGGFVANRKAYV